MTDDDIDNETIVNERDLLHIVWKRSYTMKPKRSQSVNLVGNLHSDRCMTPAYGIKPLLPYIDPSWVIWEPACGTGNLVGAMREHGNKVIATDINDDYMRDLHNIPGVNFFKSKPTKFDAIVTNPPYSLKYHWLERCYELGKPFALLVPLETLGSQRAQELFKRYGQFEELSLRNNTRADIVGLPEVMLLYRRINFIMPNIGATGSSAQFPVIWLCWRMLPAPMCYGMIDHE